jgi:low affinity Fe/Cu permease
VTEEGFGKIATRVAHAVGRPIVFAVAFVLLTIWAASGPFLGYSDAWQLVVNTATTIITFLMVFLIQNTQNRDSLAVQVKLDELIRAVADARNNFIDLETLSEKQLEALRAKLSHLGSNARAHGTNEIKDAHRQCG